jgi:beta-lactamase class A
MNGAMPLYGFFYLTLVASAVVFDSTADRPQEKPHEKSHDWAGNAMQDNKSKSTDVLEKRLITYTRDLREKIGIALSIPDANLYLGLNDTMKFHAASTMKVPVMLEVFRQAEEGRFDLHDSLTVKNEFFSIVDGSPYSLDVKDDSADRLYSLLGRKQSIMQLVEEMIVTSGNLATNLLVELTGAGTIQNSMRRLGAANIEILRGVEDGKAYRAGLNNRTTAKDMTIILQALLEGKAAAGKDTETMIRILLDQKFNEKIPAGLPAGVKVAHKTGSIPGYVEHDAGIVYPPGRTPYILSVLTEGFADEESANRCIVGISSMVYKWYTE